MVPDRAFSNCLYLGRQRGASTIELTIVITLFLVLVAVVFLGFQTWRIEANQATCITNLSSIQKAVESYQNTAALPGVPALPALNADRLSALNARLSALDPDTLSRLNTDIQKVTKSYQLTAGVPALNADIIAVWKAAWITGADKGACLVNLSSLQKCVRGYQNMKKLVTGDPLTVDTLMRAGYFTSVPTCPAGGAYSFLDTVPAAGEAWATCKVADHAPSQAALDNW